MYILLQTNDQFNFKTTSLKLINKKNIEKNTRTLKKYIQSYVKKNMNTFCNFFVLFT